MSNKHKVQMIVCYWCYVYNQDFRRVFDEKRGDKKICFVRDMSIMTLITWNKTMTKIECAKYFDRDRTTIANSIKNAKKAMIKDKSIKNNIDTILHCVEQIANNTKSICL